MGSSKQLKNEPLETVLVVSMGFLVLYLFFGLEWGIWVSLASGIGGLFISPFRYGLHRFWGKLTWVLALIVPNILLTLVYFLILTPTALISRRKNPSLQSFKKNNHSSQFSENPKTFPKENFEKLW